MVKPMDGAHRPRSRFCHGYLRSLPLGETSTERAECGPHSENDEYARAD